MTDDDLRHRISVRAYYRWQFRCRWHMHNDALGDWLYAEYVERLLREIEYC